MSRARMASASFNSAIGSDLNVIELVGGRIVRAERGILLFLQSLNQRLGVFLPADRGDLHIITGV